MYADIVRYHLRYSWKHAKRDGILCPEWENDFESFCQWAVGQGYKEGDTVRRKNSKLPKSPENCYIYSPGSATTNRPQMLRLSDAVRFDKTVADFMETLRKATPDAEHRLVQRIRDGDMGAEWYG